MRWFSLQGPEGNPQGQFIEISLWRHVGHGGAMMLWDCLKGTVRSVLSEFILEEVF